MVRPELLVSRFEIQARGDISDGRGNSFRVEYDRETGMTVILPDDDPKNADRFSSGELK